MVGFTGKLSGQESIQTAPNFRKSQTAVGGPRNLNVKSKKKQHSVKKQRNQDGRQSEGPAHGVRKS